MGGLVTGRTSAAMRLHRGPNTLRGGWTERASRATRSRLGPWCPEVFEPGQRGVLNAMVRYPWFADVDGVEICTDAHHAEGRGGTAELVYVCLRLSSAGTPYPDDRNAEGPWMLQLPQWSHVTLAYAPAPGGGG